MNPFDQNIICIINIYFFTKPRSSLNPTSAPLDVYRSIIHSFIATRPILSAIKMPPAIPYRIVGALSRHSSYTYSFFKFICINFTSSASRPNRFRPTNKYPRAVGGRPGWRDRQRLLRLYYWLIVVMARKDV